MLPLQPEPFRTTMPVRCRSRSRPIGGDRCGRDPRADLRQRLRGPGRCGGRLRAGTGRLRAGGSVARPTRPRSDRDRRRGAGRSRAGCGPALSRRGGARGSGPVAGPSIDRALAAVAATALAGGRAVAVARPLPASFDRIAAWIATCQGRASSSCHRACCCVPPTVPPSPRGTDTWRCVETLEPLAGYRPCVGVFLLNDQGQVLVGQRRDMAEDVADAQGGIDPPETPVEAGLREMLEEIGTDRALLLRQSGVWRSTSCPNRSHARVGAGAMPARPRNGWPIASPAATPTFAWTRRTPSSAPGAGRRRRRFPDLIVPFKRDVYVSVVAEFRPLWV